MHNTLRAAVQCRSSLARPDVRVVHVSNRHKWVELEHKTYIAVFFTYFTVFFQQLLCAILWRLTVKK